MAATKGVDFLKQISKIMTSANGFDSVLKNVNKSIASWKKKFIFGYFFSD